MNKGEMSEMGSELRQKDIKQEELEHAYREKADAYVAAIMAGDQKLADKIRSEQKNLMVEMRMTNPNIPLTNLEEDYKQLAEDETYLNHKKLNKDKDEWQSN